MKSASDHSLTKNYLIVISITLASNILGFIKDILIANYFGISSDVDVFIVAFAVISIFTLILSSGPLQSAFIPSFSRFYSESERTGWNFFSDTLNVTAAACLIIVICIVSILVLLPDLSRAIAPGFSSKQLNTLNSFIFILAVTVVLSAVSIIFVSLLQLFGRFATSVLPPVISNLIILAAIFFFHSSSGVYSLVYGITAGSFAALLWLFFFVSKIGPRYNFFKINNKRSIREFITFISPMILLIFIDQLSALVQKTIVSYTGSGNISALNYAYKVVGIPVGLFGMGIATVIFPTLSLLISQKDRNELIREKVENGMNYLIYLLIPITFFFVAFSQPIIQFLFERGHFTHEATTRTAVAFTYYSIGIIGQALIVYFHRLFYACGDSKIPLKVGMITAVFHVILCFSLVEIFDYVGIAVATTVYAYIYFIILFVLLYRKHIQFEYKHAMVLLGKTSLASVASLILVRMLLAHHSDSAFFVPVSCIAYVILFFAITGALKINESKILYTTVRSYFVKGEV